MSTLPSMRGWAPQAVFGAATLAAGLSLLAPAQRAEACGGLFCNQNTGVVNQTAEQIIFSDNQDGTVTAVVQILYNGPADSFSWVLPVPGVPDVEVSSNQAFARLQAATNPNYQLNRIIEGECNDNGFGRGGAGNPAPQADNDGAEEGANNDPGVTVVGAGSVGPYDYEVIAVDPELEDLAEVAVQWLSDNGYDVTAIGPDVLRPYLEDGLNLIAFRLNKSSEAGAIRPVVLTYTTDHPMIPIRPTAVAVNDNMGIMTFVLGQDRAIPGNYRHLEINEAVLNWFNPNSNYAQTINVAADESGGQGFVTEFAGASSAFAETIFGTFEAENWDRIQGQDWAGREGQLLAEIASSYSGWDGLAESLDGNIVLPENVTLAEFAACIFCFDLVNQSDLEGFEAGTFLAAIEQNLIEPMRATQALLDSQPYLSRMFTTMSAREMTLDPSFLFNTSLPDVNNVHVADQTIECSPEFSQFDAPWRVELAQGVVVRGQGQVWPFDTEGELPANREIRQMGEEGAGDVIADNTMVINQAIERSNANFPSPTPSTGGGEVDACACAQAPARPARLPLGLLSLALVAFGAFITRRR